MYPVAFTRAGLRGSACSVFLILLVALTHDLSSFPLALLSPLGLPLLASDGMPFPYYPTHPDIQKDS